jgi:ActR/RegA family two-component response regulator
MSRKKATPEAAPSRLPRTFVLADPTPAGAAMAEALRCQAISVYCAHTVQRTVAAILHAPPALAVCERRLADGTALDLLAEVRRLGVGTRVIVVTAFGSIESASLCVRAGATDYLTKPVAVRQILALGLDRCPSASFSDAMTIEDARRQYIKDMLSTYRSVARSAQVLGLDRRSLRRMMGRLQLLDRQGLDPRASGSRGVLPEHATEGPSVHAEDGGGHGDGS